MGYEKCPCPIAKIERLLLSTDGSEYCAGAVTEAVNIAKACGRKP